MKFVMLSSQEKKIFTIAWLEVNTAIGNFVIQKEHVPTVLLVLPNEPITVCLANGKQETFTTPGGVLEITRQEALLLLYNA